MPTVFIIHGFRFFFFSNEGTEPIHIHVEKAGNYAKFWLQPVCLARNYRFSSSELRKIMEIIEENKKKVEEKWNDYFKFK
jgi:hypothetical protein